MKVKSLIQISQPEETKMGGDRFTLVQEREEGVGLGVDGREEERERDRENEKETDSKLMRERKIDRNN